MRSLAARITSLENIGRWQNVDRDSLVDLTPWVLDAPEDDYIHGAWIRFLLIQPQAVSWLIAEGFTRAEAEAMVKDVRCCVADSMAVNMALSRVPRDIWPRYEKVYQDAELIRQRTWPIEYLEDEL